MNEQNYKVLANIIGGVESGGQVYGKQLYNAYAAPYTNTPNEHGPTLGWAQNYGNEGRKLIQMIYDADPTAFKKIDTCTPSIQSKLSDSWENGWNPSLAQKAVLIKLITTDIGKRCQDELFIKLMKRFVVDCEETYTKEIPGVMMYCQIRHLGGKDPTDRIFKRCNGNYSLDNIMASLKKDQSDTSSSNQVGDKKFWSRHEKCVEFIKKYVVSENATAPTQAASSDVKKEVVNTASALSRAKTLLRQPQGSTMTGYTPDGKAYFVSANAWYKTPKKGDIIYFYSSSKGRVGHTGIVERVDSANKIVYTVEGNTSSTEYAENGGCVARHSYSYASQGGTNRVNGFGRPDFARAGVTADQFVSMAVSYLGYLEKRSNSQLDSKTANAGSNNYQKFQRDIGAGNGDQWCQYFVDAIALYTCQGVTSNTTVQKGNTLNENSKWTGYVTADSLNVRTWAGVENDTCSFSPLSKGTSVGVCDTVNAEDGSAWYYILYGGKHGFVSGQYISKTKPTTTTTTKAVTTTKAAATTQKLKMGDTGSAVKTMQKMLIKCGYSCGSAGADGEFGEGTKAAVIKYQKAKGITPANGTYGPKTTAALTADYKKKTATTTAKKTTTSAPTAKKTMLSQAKIVGQMAKDNKWKYGDSHSLPPCKDKWISCDRIVARTLYDLGYTSQPKGGITINNGMGTYLKNWGFTKVTSTSKIKPGAIVAVGRNGDIEHVFIVEKYNDKTGVCSKYDAGSDERIKKACYFKNVQLLEWSNRQFICAWNVPSKIA